MINVVAQIMANPFHTPYKVGIGIGHIDADTTCEVAEPADVRMPRVGDRGPLFVAGQETEYWRAVHRRVAVGNVDPHLIASGIYGLITDTPLAEVFQIADSTDTSQLISDKIADR